jgi:hypothetical protein
MQFKSIRLIGLVLFIFILGLGLNKNGEMKDILPPRNNQTLTASFLYPQGTLSA